MKKLLLILIVLLTWGAFAQAAMIPVPEANWTGSRSTLTDDGGSGETSGTDDQVYATGNWGDAGNGFRIAWEITTNTSGSFHYQYTLSGASGGALSSNMSHWILELSPGAVTGDFQNMTPTNTTGISTWLASNPSNPYMGGNIYGYKWNQTTDFPQTGYPVEGSVTYTFTFDTFRQPVWGDFYARCGIEPTPGGGGVFNTAQNWGLYNQIEPGDTDWNTLDFIPVPDSKIPLPPSALLLGSGLLGLGLLGWRRKRS